MLVFIAFDSPVNALLDRLEREGRLPTIAGLRRTGVTVDIQPSSTYAAAGTYQTLYTGTGLGAHGHYFPLKWSPADQRLRFMDRFPGPETIWERACRAGRRCLVIDPYAGLPPRRVNGACISGIGFTNRLSLRRFSVPGGAARRLPRELRRSPSAEEAFGRPDARELAGLREVLLAAPGRAADAVAAFLRDDPYDLVWVMLSSVHLAGHHFYDLSQLDQSRLDGPARAVLEGTLADVYAAADAALGRLVGGLPEDADIVVFSPIGMGPNTSRSDLLPDMLAAVLEGGPSGGRAQRSAVPRIETLREAVPVHVRRSIAGALPAALTVELTARLSVSGLDWSRVSAFALPSDHLGYIRLNVRGRERLGIVDPVEAPGLEELIIDGLSTFADEDGVPSVESVVRLRGSLDGANASDLPDLVVRWSDRPASGIRVVSSPRYGDVLRRGAGTGRSGNHTDDAWGLVLARSARLRLPSEALRLEDMAATACARLGAHLDGIEGQAFLDS